MIALEILYSFAVIIASIVSWGEFSRASARYKKYTHQGNDPLSLFICSHHIRVSLFNMVICGILFITIILILLNNHLGIFKDRSISSEMIGLTSATLIIMLKLLMYKYDYNMMNDTAQVLQNRENDNAKVAY